VSAGPAAGPRIEHLEFVEAELRTMRMQPGLQRALPLQQAAATSTLTVREQVALVARGLSNRDIAEALVISEGTAEVHVKHILSKSASSRAIRSRSGRLATDLACDGLHHIISRRFAV
jgi:DNA-binding NarL/FixJ family response regulator